MPNPVMPKNESDERREPVWRRGGTLLQWSASSDRMKACDAMATILLPSLAPKGPDKAFAAPAARRVGRCFAPAVRMTVERYFEAGADAKAV